MNIMIPPLSPTFYHNFTTIMSLDKIFLLKSEKKEFVQRSYSFFSKLSYETAIRQGIGQKKKETSVSFFHIQSKSALLTFICQLCHIQDMHDEGASLHRMQDT